MTTLGDDEDVLFHSVLGEAGTLYEAFSAVRQARELTKAELEQFADEVYDVKLKEIRSWAETRCGRPAPRAEFECKAKRKPIPWRWAA
eukprot:7939554-Alexandrium_andersonii.AAC.1